MYISWLDCHPDKMEVVGSNPTIPTIFVYLFKYCCGSSSVGRALAFQAKGREFEPRLPLKLKDSFHLCGQGGYFFICLFALLI